MSYKRWGVVIFSVLGLALAYVFQKKFLLLFDDGVFSHFQQFFLSKGLRFVLNDLLMILLIYGLFEQRKYVLFAFYVQLIGLLFIFIPYMVLSYHGYHGAIVSFMHRLVINPLLLLLLIPAFYYQLRNHE